MNTTKDSGTVGGWFKNHRLVIAIAVLFAVFASVYAMPPLACCFAWQRLLNALGFLVYGTILFFLYSLLPDLPLSSSVLTVFNIMLIVCLGFVVGFAIGSLWDRGNVGRVILVGILVLNACFGLWLVFSVDVLVGPAYAECEYFASQTDGVRLIAYPEYGWLPGAHFFLLSTTDGGKTWKQFKQFRHDDPVDPQCDNVKASDAEVFWHWSGYPSRTIYSLDGGKTWKMNEWDKI